MIFEIFLSEIKLLGLVLYQYFLIVKFNFDNISIFSSHTILNTSVASPDIYTQSFCIVGIENENSMRSKKWYLKPYFKSC